MKTKGCRARVVVGTAVLVSALTWTAVAACANDDAPPTSLVDVVTVGDARTCARDVGSKWSVQSVRGRAALANAAIAASSGVGCAAMAVAVQVDIVSRSDGHLQLDNVATAENEDGVASQTGAFAFQFVVASAGDLTVDRRMRAELAAIDADLDDELLAIETEIEDRPGVALPDDLPPDELADVAAARHPLPPDLTQRVADAATRAAARTEATLARWYPGAVHDDPSPAANGPGQPAGGIPAPRATPVVTITSHIAREVG